MRAIILYGFYFSLFLLSCQQNEKDNQQPNIILIYADDLGRGMLSIYGQEHFTTPAIDRLADEGMRFENAYGCQYCAPARASLISGMHDCHANGWSLTNAGIYVKPADEINLDEISEKIHKVSKLTQEGEVFLGTVAKNAGYITAEFGKLEWGFATTAQRIKSHGWDYHFGYYDHQRCHGFYPPFLFENGELIEIPGNTHINCGKTSEPETEDAFTDRWNKAGKEVYSEYIFLDKMFTFMDEHNPKNTQQPFFIFYSTQLPHGPVSVPEVHPELANNSELTEIEKEYATMVKILDNSVDRIYSKLQEMKILDNTIIIFTSDNGHEIYTAQAGRTQKAHTKLSGGKFDNIHNKYYSEVNGDIFDGNDGMAGLKRSNWEGGVRVPLIWYWKGKIRSGLSSNQLVANYDILNTISDLAAAQNVEGKDSKSYAETLLGGKSEEKDYTIFSSNLGPAIVTKDGWKLRYHLMADVFQLYFLPEDYREENVLNDQHSEKVEMLKTILLEECDGDFRNGGPATFVNPQL